MPLSMTLPTRAETPSSPRNDVGAAGAPLVILATFGTRGDLDPFVLMARGLQSRGHRVCIVTTRDHAPRLLESGLPHRVYGSVDQVDAVLNDPDLWDERKGLAVIGRGMAAGLAEAVELVSALAGDAPCVAVCHPFMIPVADIARRDRPRLHVVGAWLAPSNLRSVHDPMMLGPRRVPGWMPLAWRRALWRFVDRHWIDNVMLPGINAVRAARGMAAVAHFFEHLGECCDASLALFPSWFAPRAPDWPAPFSEAGFGLAPVEESAPLSPELEHFLAAGSSPVIVTFGTGMRHATAAFGHCSAALQALGRRGLFVSASEVQRPAHLPQQILWVTRTPFARLLPSAAAIVHHGGIGTAAEGLRAGIPQLVVASGFDQFDNGERLRRLGVGDLMRATKSSPARLERRLSALLESADTRSACALHRSRFDADAPSDAFVDRVAEAVASACAA